MAPQDTPQDAPAKKKTWMLALALPIVLLALPVATFLKPKTDNNTSKPTIADKKKPDPTGCSICGGCVMSTDGDHVYTSIHPTVGWSPGTTPIQIDPAPGTTPTTLLTLSMPSPDPAGQWTRWDLPRHHHDVVAGTATLVFTLYGDTGSVSFAPLVGTCPFTTFP